MRESEADPVGVITLEVPAHAAPAADVTGVVRSFLETMRDFDLPAVIGRDPSGAGDRVSALLLCDQTGRPLRAATTAGALHWERCDLVALARALAHGFGSDIRLGGEPIDDGGSESRWGSARELQLQRSPSAAADLRSSSELDLQLSSERGLPRPGTARPELPGPREAEPELPRMRDALPYPRPLGRVAWTTKESGDILPLIARTADQPLGVVDLDGRRLVAPTRTQDGVRPSPNWMIGAELLMWREGDRRGMASYAGRELLVHSFDDEPRIVDPTLGWERDISGNRVGDYLVRLVPGPADPQEWAKRFGLDGERAERLRVLLRRRGSTDTTLARAAEILGVPPSLAEVAEGRVEQESLPGYAVVAPASVMQTIRSGLIDDLTDARGNPFYAWYRFSSRHPRWRLLVTTLAIVLLTVMTVMDVSDGDMRTVWVQVLGIALWVLDMVIPRSTAPVEREEP